MTPVLNPQSSVLPFWDCHAAIGGWTVPPPGGLLDAAGLRRELAAAGIAGALVHHGLARDYDPGVGNDALLRELLGVSAPGLQPPIPSSQSPRLVPCATVLPHHTGEFPPPRDHLPRLIAQGVHAVRLYPKQHNFSLEDWCASELLAGLAAHRLPVSIDLAETTWSDVHRVCAAYPDLPLIVTRVNYRQERFLYPLWERHANLYVDVSHFQAHRALEEAIARFGPDRLLFGTGLPFYAPGGPLFLVLRAETDDAARRAIAGHNLLRLLEGVRPC